jgi:hypothetical protein
LQRLEGLALLIASVVLFASSDQTWWWFALLLLAPDLSMIGYLGGPRVGAAIYNLGHTFIWPVGLVTYGVVGELPVALAIGAIWLAHIGMDRALGYGLKLTDSFQDTHLGMIGKSRRTPSAGSAG